MKKYSLEQLIEMADKIDSILTSGEYGYRVFYNPLLELEEIINDETKKVEYTYYLKGLTDKESGEEIKHGVNEYFYLQEKFDNKTGQFKECSGYYMENLINNIQILIDFKNLNFDAVVDYKDVTFEELLPILENHVKYFINKMGVFEVFRLF